MVAVVQDLASAYATENEFFLTTFVTFCSPQSLQKLATSIRLGKVRLFEGSISQLLVQSRKS